MSLLASVPYLFVHVHVLYIIAYELFAKIVSISFVLAKVVTMLLKEFYTSVISSEVVRVNFLQDNMLLGKLENHNPCQKCGTQMAQKRRKTRADE